MRRGVAVVVLAAAVACGELTGAGDDPTSNADAGAADGASSVDGASSADGAGPGDGGADGALSTLDAKVFATDMVAPVSLATDGVSWVFWARPGGGGGLFRKAISGLGAAERYRDLNITGVAHSGNRIYVARVPDGAGGSCEIQSFSSTELATVDYSETCTVGDTMKLANDGSTLFMMGPNGKIRRFDNNEFPPITPTSMTGTAPGFGEAEAGVLFYTSGAFVLAGGASAGTVLSTDWELVGVGLSGKYLYATAKRATGERAILRAPRGPLPLTLDRVWTRPASVEIGDILALANDHLYWVEGTDILEATPP